jgi:hypothetical protein
MVTNDAWQAMATILELAKHKGGARQSKATACSLKPCCMWPGRGAPGATCRWQFDNGDALYHCFRRWEIGERWRRSWGALQYEVCAVAKVLFIDNTIGRAHRHAAAPPKSRGQAVPALGRALGGMTTHIHTCCIAEGMLVSITLTSGARNDTPGFDANATCGTRPGSVS